MTLWRQKQKESFTSIEALADFLHLDSEKRALLAKRPFPLLLPIRLAEKIPKNTLDHPLARQFLPLNEENNDAVGYMVDPVGDRLSQKCNKLLHKYEGRVLIYPTGACAMHCRYCFRQNFNYNEKPSDHLTEALNYIKNNRSLHEVILSGGDPLSLSDEKLSFLLQEISKIAHIQLIRFHTRFPIGIPERITKEFLDILQACSKQIVFIAHINHVLELDQEVKEALQQVAKLGIPLLSQSVLLKGVNDDKEVLKELFLALISAGIIPYYLHQLDKVVGTSHFAVSVDTGKDLLEALRSELPGYAIPRYVQEIQGKPSKTPI